MIMWKLFASIITDVNRVSELSVLFHTEVPACPYTAALIHHENLGVFMNFMN
jgi:hypothetical protein